MTRSVQSALGRYHEGGTEFEHPTAPASGLRLAARCCCEAPRNSRTHALPLDPIIEDRGRARVNRGFNRHSHPARAASVASSREPGCGTFARLSEYSACPSTRAVIECRRTAWASPASPRLS